MPDLELFGTAACPYTEEMRDWLEFRGQKFTEYDVERDRNARERLRGLSASSHIVPVLVEDGKVVQVGWQGRGCSIE
ncbi:MAG: NrdH-redoxin [Acidobacteria bacterium]|jgi:glutaredoxin|nr:MAG: NrdH-redoxin [Acidobacteriota bacterium]